ncbi:MAG: HU family DNA-binding protein [Bacteroidales bacterium]|nr:HU family DNA-binding protein [Bacteroidales bacterium]MBD5284428.1 HU family DNA-binding protein [Bacteroides sp.]
MDNKTLIDKLSVRSATTPAEAERLLDAFARVVADAASVYDSVALPAFGTFEVRKRAERVAVHPATGKRLLIPPKLALVFRPSSILKQKVNE